MRLHHVSVNEFRSLGGVTVELDGLVVLVGANSSGKSTILDAIRGVVRGVGSLRESPYGEDTGDPWVDADLFLELTASGLADHADSDLHRRLLAGECGDGLWLAPRDGLRDLLADEPLSSVQDLLATAYAEEEGPGDPNDRHLLADWMFASRFFVVADGQTWITVTSDGLRAEAAAARIAASAADDEDDGLACDAIDLVGGTPAMIPIAAGHATGDWLVPHAPVVDVNAELDGLHDEVRAAIDAIDMLLWSDPEPPPGNKPSLRREPSSSGSGTAPDLWIEGQAETQSVFWARDEVGDPESAMQWRRVRPSLVATAAVLEARANAIAPSFVTESGTIRLYLLPPTYWQSEPLECVALSTKAVCAI